MFYKLNAKYIFYVPNKLLSNVQYIVAFYILNYAFVHYVALSISENNYI